MHVPCVPISLSYHSFSLPSYSYSSYSYFVPMSSFPCLYCTLSCRLLSVYVIILSSSSFLDSFFYDAHSLSRHFIFFRVSFSFPYRLLSIYVIISYHLPPFSFPSSSMMFAFYLLVSSFFVSILHPSVSPFKHLPLLSTPKYASHLPISFLK